MIATVTVRLFSVSLYVFQASSMLISIFATASVLIDSKLSGPKGGRAISSMPFSP